MIKFPEQMAEVTETHLMCGTFDFVPPIKKGHLEYRMSLSAGGEAASPLLVRSVKVLDGKMPRPTFMKRDVEAALKTSRKLWLVVSYGTQALMTSEVRIP